MQKANVKEIFYSIQGEGKYAGQAQYFLRFCGCNLECPYCDTDYRLSKTCSVETIPGRGFDKELNNPLTVEEVVNTVEKIKSLSPTKIISLTGGEPLLQAPFLRELLPILKDKGFL
ncbi:MAG: 7-carboxy-7-deazaguanine synthase QueE, partial [Candidatus Margulisbacteria bacterium]|nr:7-carboxy-7-deazaguanine synthase QueE [Candidatus Margulisiibacteriota bacterium]